VQRGTPGARRRLRPPEGLGPPHAYARPSLRRRALPGRVEGPPKTDAGDRTIPIPEWLCEDLAGIVAARSTVDRDAYLFQTRYGNPLNGDHFREAVVRPALRAECLSDTVRTYDLRHSHAGLLIDLGANPLAIAQRMGHSDAGITLRVYSHLFNGTQVRPSEQLDALREATANSEKMADILNIENPRDLTRARHAWHISAI
jgi:integrase